MSNVTNITDPYKQTYTWWDGHVMVKFTSDGSVNKRGFQIEYSAGIDSRARRFVSIF